MKSFVQEGTSIENAFQEAWLIAGKPQKFYIKVLEEGNNTILWWKKKTFKIAFYYELSAFPNGDDNSFNGPHKSTLELGSRKNNYSKDKDSNQYQKRESQNNHQNSNQQNNKENFQHKKPYQQKNTDLEVEQKTRYNNSYSEESHFKHPRQQQRPFNKFNNQNQNHTIHESAENNHEKLFHEDKFQQSVFMWTPETADFVTKWIQSTLSNLTIEVELPLIKIDKENMYITFKEEELKKQPEYKYLPLSLVTLLQEALKKHTKDQHKIFRILIQYQ